jgi:hypothetical protein
VQGDALLHDAGRLAADSRRGKSGVKLFRIYEDDLAKLETMLPRLADALGVAMNRPDVQVMVGEVKEIVSNVRWDYGPHTEVKRITGNPPARDE